MEIEGMDSWIKKIETMKKEFPKETGRFLMKKANEVIRETKKLTPVDTGTLRNSWQRVNGGSFRQIIYNNTTYASHLEWGHRVVRGKKTIGFSRGRYMLHKGINRVKVSFYRDLRVLYKNLIEK